MIQAILIRIFGAQYQSGHLNHPKLANQRRIPILSRAYRESVRDVDLGMGIVLQLTALLGYSDLTNALKFYIDTLKDQLVRKLMHFQVQPLIHAGLDVGVSPQLLCRRLQTPSRCKRTTCYFVSKTS